MSQTDLWVISVKCNTLTMKLRKIARLECVTYVV